MWELAKQWLQRNQPAVYSNIRFYKRKVMMLSFADQCAWKGLGNTGCGDGHCMSWHRVPPRCVSIMDDNVSRTDCGNTLGAVAVR